MKKCPKCSRTYDDSWGVCLYCEVRLDGKTTAQETEAKGHRADRQNFSNLTKIKESVLLFFRSIFKGRNNPHSNHSTVNSNREDYHFKKAQSSKNISAQQFYWKAMLKDTYPPVTNAWNVNFNNGNVNNNDKTNTYYVRPVRGG